MSRGDRNEMGRHGNMRPNRGERLPDRMDGRGGHDSRREQPHDDRHGRR